METIKNWITLAALIVGLFVACITLWQKINELLKTDERKQKTWAIFSSVFVGALWCSPIILYHAVSWGVAMWTAFGAWLFFNALFLRKPNPATRTEIVWLIFMAINLVFIVIMGVIDVISGQQGNINELTKFITTPGK